MEYDNVLLEKEDFLATLYINRPKVLNALNRETLLDILSALDDVAKDPAIKVLIITGAGEKAFVAGADIVYMQSLNPVHGRAMSKLGQRTMRQIELMEKPVIAAVNGYALGGGCELAMACDIRLASEKAVFGQPEVGLGIVPGFGGTQRLARLVGEGRAKELIFTAKSVKAEEAYRIGLVNHVYPAEELLDQAKALAKKIAKQAPVAVAYSKFAINRGLQVDIDSGATTESDMFGICCATYDKKEGMQAFVEKRPAQFKGE